MANDYSLSDADFGTQNNNPGSSSQNYSLTDDDFKAPVHDPSSAVRGAFISAAKNLPADVVAGLAEGGHGLLNAPSNLAPILSRLSGTSGLLQMGGIDPSQVTNLIPRQKEYDFSAMLGVPNPTLGDKLIQGAAQYLPYGLGGEAALADNPSLMGRLVNQAGTGASFGLTQSPTPVKSAAIDAGINTVGQVGSEGLGSLWRSIIGSPNTINAIGNSTLDYLTKQAANKRALSPAEVADNVQKNYVDINGNTLPVDIGTAANNPLLKTVNSAITPVPFSGAAQRVNSINDALLTKKITDTQSQVSSLKNNPEADYINGKLQALQQNPVADNLQKQISELQTNPTADNLTSQISDISKQSDQHDASISQAPAYLNSLASPVSDRANLNLSLKKDVSSAYKDNKTEANKLYAPINNSTLRLDQLGTGNNFPQYGAAAQELIAKQENFNNLFDSDSDLGTKLNNEIDKANSFTANSNNWGVTLPEAVQRMQTLGQLSSSAYSQGRRHEGMLLGNLQDGLSNDVDDLLRNSGNKNVADQLAQANSFYKSSVVPFWKNNEIRKSVTDQNYIPQSAKLSKALHDSNNESIMNQLPNDTKNTALYSLITGGKGSSQGISNMTPDQIGAAYSKLPVDSKRVISSYNADADSYFESLPTLMNRRDALNDNTAELNKQLQGSVKGNDIQTKNLNSQLQASLKNNQSQQQALQKQLQSSISKNSAQQKAAQTNLDTLIQQKYGVTPGGTPQTDILSSLLKAGGLALGLAHYAGKGALASTLLLPPLARTANKALSNPDLLQAYINGTKLPVKPQVNMGKYINPMLQSLISGLNRGSQ